MANPYAPMRQRAAVFDGTAGWGSVIVTLAALWFGFALVFDVVFMLTAPFITSDAVDAFFFGSTPAAVRWTLASFGIYIAILYAALRAQHGLGLSATIGTTGPAAYQFAWICVYLTPLYAVMMIPALSDPAPYQNLSLGAWLALLPATLPLLFIQIGAEELVFRGYLQSHIAALSRKPLVWMGIPSVLFGLIHFDPTLPALSAWGYVAWATCLGVVCADLTARTGTLGPALAVHFVNNFAAILVLASDDWLYGASLWIWPTFGQPWVPSIPYDPLFLLTLWITARLALRR